MLTHKRTKKGKNGSKRRRARSRKVRKSRRVGGGRFSSIFKSKKPKTSYTPVHNRPESPVASTPKLTAEEKLCEVFNINPARCKEAYKNFDEWYYDQVYDKGNNYDYSQYKAAEKYFGEDSLGKKYVNVE